MVRLKINPTHSHGNPGDATVSVSELFRVLLKWLTGCQMSLCKLTWYLCFCGKLSCITTLYSREKKKKKLEISVCLVSFFFSLVLFIWKLE